MAIAKILLYYAFTPLADPDAVRLWQRDLAESLGLRGRILISKDGINGTLGGELRRAQALRAQDPRLPGVQAHRLQVERGHGPRRRRREPRLPEAQREGARRDRVVRRARRAARRRATASSAAAPTLAPTRCTSSSPSAATTSSFFDGRNALEAAIGRFAGAVVPDVATTRDFVDRTRPRQVRRPQGAPGRHVLHGRHPLRGALEPHGRAAASARSTSSTAASCATASASATTASGRGRSTSSTSAARSTSATTPRSSARASCAATPTKRMQNCADASCREQLVVCESCGSAACTLHVPSPVE